ncbi:phenylalanine--tRNA ligase subunit beta [Marinagarivorans algicola]|uniref:phenylalanine--tRNA ligase subunit beta n=1 Tax=Marinagarivorans algicola TaxID=1513270 RepID=UPI0006B69738|nr:phenylalanine--tRNA ligase subunit beta [Marinagarivorans algicola]
MKISESWLREWANPSIGTNDLVAQVTMAGLEVDAVEPVAGEFSGVVVGKIVAVTQHPDADKLRICQVEGHAEGMQQVVCGAPNAREGLIAPFAIIGAKLPGDFKIKKAKLRGVESFGMLCGQTELACGDDDSGLWELPSDAPVGVDLREYLDLNDKILELDLTPNRSDCLSVRGIAREVSVLNHCAYNPVAIEALAPEHNEVRQVSLNAGDACPRYVGRLIKGINNKAPSPSWLVEKLRRSGVASLGAVVDVTNYVLLELGQPMHAFDAAKVQGNITVRLAEAGEQLELLNDQTVTLKPNVLVIADEQKALAFAGVMGGKASAVSDDTTDILLESAFFAPIAIAGRARDFGLHTDSSHRYERGVDYQLQHQALERATGLIKDICGGQVGEVFSAVNEADLPKPAVITLNKNRLAKTLGLRLEDAQVERLLTGLGLELVEQNDDAWQFVGPSYRFDIAIDADLVEELARLYGYDKLPTRTPVFANELPSTPENAVSLRGLSAALVARGYREAITYSFVDPKVHAHFSEDKKVVTLKNPISADMADMRTSLLPGLVQALKYNLNRQQTRASLFESGLVFESGEPDSADTYPQSRRIAGLLYGNRQATTWCHAKEAIDFFDAKGDVEALLAVTRNSAAFSFVPCVQPASYMHPGQCADVRLDGRRVGFVGALHPSTAKALDCGKNIFVFELALEALLEGAVPAFNPLSRFPEVSRDLALVVEQSVNATVLEAAIAKAAGEHLKAVSLFDVYVGQGVPDGHKSLAYNLTFQHAERTLKDDEIQQAIDNVVKTLAEGYGANLR